MNEINEKDVQTELKWMDEELKELEQTKQEFVGERLPYMKFEEKKTAEVDIDISKPFGVWVDQAKGVTKAIIELTHDNTRKVWFLNKRNPIYRDILKGVKEGITKFKVLQIGSQADTKYELIE